MSGIEVSVSSPGLKRWQNIIRIMQGRAPVTAASATRAMANDCVRFIHLHASGRPGPRVVTGAYRASIQITDFKSDHSGASATISTSAPQAARLEYGFVGVDSRGRHYHQPAFPHWRPGLQDVANHKSYYFSILKKGILGHL